VITDDPSFLFKHLAPRDIFCFWLVLEFPEGTVLSPIPGVFGWGLFFIFCEDHALGGFSGETLHGHSFNVQSRLMPLYATCLPLIRRRIKGIIAMGLSGCQEF